MAGMAGIFSMGEFQSLGPRSTRCMVEMFQMGWNHQLDLPTWMVNLYGKGAWIPIEDP